MFKILKPESHQEVLERIKKFIASKPDEEDSLSMISVAAEKVGFGGVIQGDRANQGKIRRVIVRTRRKRRERGRTGGDIKLRHTGSYHRKGCVS